MTVFHGLHEIFQVVGQTLFLFVDIQFLDIINHFLLQAVLVVFHIGNRFQGFHQTLADALGGGLLVWFGAAFLVLLYAFPQLAYVLYVRGEFLLQCGTFLFAEVHELADGFLDGSPYGCPFLLVQFFHFRTGHDVRQAQ